MLNISPFILFCGTKLVSLSERFPFQKTFMWNAFPIFQTQSTSWNICKVECKCMQTSRDKLAFLRSWTARPNDQFNLNRTMLKYSMTFTLIANRNSERSKRKTHNWSNLYLLFILILVVSGWRMIFKTGTQTTITVYLNWWISSERKSMPTVSSVLWIVGYGVKKRKIRRCIWWAGKFKGTDISVVKL